MATADQDRDAALEKVLTASLARVIDWLKFAEAKNAALLTFSSGWALGMLSFIFNQQDPSRLLQGVVIAGLVLMLVGIGHAVVALAPQTDISRFMRPGRPKVSAPDEPNLLYFNHIGRLDAVEAPAAMVERYGPPAGRGFADEFFRDLGVQIAVNSQIASRKFKLFDGGAGFAVLGAVVMGAGALGDRLIQWICT